MTLAHAVDEYGYWAVLIGCFLEGETVLVLASLAAQFGYLALPQVLLAAAVGGFCTDETAYFAGRWLGPRAYAWSPRLTAVQRRVGERLHRNAEWIGFSVRFAIGLRTAVPMAVGVSGIPPIRFALPNAAGAAVWAIAIGATTYAFGSALKPWLEDAKTDVQLAVPAILVILLLGYASRRVFRAWSSTGRTHRGDDG